MTENIGSFIIAKQDFSDYFKSQKTGKIMIFDTEEDARLTCGMYELENVMILEIKDTYSESDIEYSEW